MFTNYNDQHTLPSWAIGLTKGEFVIGAQLYTRFPETMGNAVLIEIHDINSKRLLEAGIYKSYKVITDIGTEFSCVDIEAHFFLGRYVMDVEEAIARRKRVCKHCGVSL